MWLRCCRHKSHLTYLTSSHAQNKDVSAATTTFYPGIDRGYQGNGEPCNCCAGSYWKVIQINQREPTQWASTTLTRTLEEMMGLGPDYQRSGNK